MLYNLEKGKKIVEAAKKSRLFCLLPIFAVFFISVKTNVVYTQHNTYQSLYMYDALQINPAYAGMKEALNINFNYRNQWLKVPGSPTTYSLNTHFLTKNKKNGIGFVLLKDEIGVYNKTNFQLNYSYKLLFKNAQQFAFGVSSGFSRVTNRFDQLIINNDDDLVFNNQIGENEFITDLGVMYKSKKLLIGLSAPRINALLDENNYQAINVYSSFLVQLQKNVKLKPTLFLRYIKNSPLVIDLNVTTYFKKFSTGLGYRNNQVVSLFGQIQLNKQFSLGYCYDYGYGKITQHFKSTHELMINYTLDFTENVQSPRYF